MVGNKSGDLTVIGYTDTCPKMCICKCSCGKIYHAKSGDIKFNKVKSCGHIKENMKNKYKFEDDYVIGITNKGEEFYVDLDDYEKIKDYTWRISSNGYVQTSIHGKNRNECKVIEMHSYLMNNNIYSGLTVDHINRNKRDNRRYNLRLVSYSLNGFNIAKQKNNTSGKTGVSFNKKNNNYIAYIRCKKNIYLGSFATFEEAVMAREKAEIKYFGENPMN